MGLYLCVFKEDEELDGLEVGSYDDFGFLRDTIAASLEGGDRGSRFPVLMLHPDNDGAWSVDECRDLEREIRFIGDAFRQAPPVGFRSSWQRQVAKELNLRPICLNDSFIDVDGQPVLDRLLELCQLAQKVGEPILFQ